MTIFMPPRGGRLMEIIKAVLEENETADTADLVDVVLAQIPEGLEEEYLREAIGAWMIPSDLMDGGVPHGTVHREG